MRLRTLSTLGIAFGLLVLVATTATVLTMRADFRQQDASLGGLDELRERTLRLGLSLEQLFLGGQLTLDASIARQLDELQQRLAARDAPAVARLADSVAELGRVYQNSRGRLEEGVAQSGASIASMPVRDRAVAIGYNQLRMHTSSLYHVLGRHYRQQFDETVWTLDLSLNLVLGAGVVIAATLLGMFWQVRRRLVAPVGRLADALADMRSGRMEPRPEIEAGSGELAWLGRDINETARELQRQRHAVGQYERQLSDELQLRTDIIDGLPAQVALLDAEGVIRVVNAAWQQFARENGHHGDDVGTSYLTVCEQATGASVDDATAALEGLRALLSGQRTRLQTDYPCHGPNSVRWYRLIAVAVRHKGHAVSGVIVMHIDITESRLAEDRVRELAYRDPLTALASRAALVEEVDAWMADVGECAPATAYLAMLDLVNFHDVNEARGYDTGNRLLRAVGQRLVSGLGESATVARMGGDGFAALMCGGVSMGAEEVAAALRAAFDEEFHGPGSSIQLDAHIGIVDLHNTGMASDAFRRAELALLTARRHGDGRSVIFTPALEEQTLERIRLSDGLRTALLEGQFELHYQPKVDLESGRLIGAEALLRWRHPEYGLLPPGRFVPVAESSQLIVPIGEWVIREACRNLREWQAAGLEIVRVAVNISLKQFRFSDVVAIVRDALAEAALPPEALTLEITESVFEGDLAALSDTLRELRELGVDIALDDFGTGYSSLRYLQNYPFTEIKIDRSFVQRMTSDAYSQAIVRMVIEIARTLGARVVGEGIERPSDRDALLAVGCEVGQGFYYSMPLEREDFVWLLAEQRTLPVSAIG